MKTLIILYIIGELSLEKFTEASILYYDIDHKEGRADNVKEIMEGATDAEITENMLENTKADYKRGNYNR